MSEYCEGSDIFKGSKKRFFLGSLPHQVHKKLPMFFLCHALQDADWSLEPNIKTLTEDLNTIRKVRELYNTMLYL